MHQKLSSSINRNRNNISSQKETTINNANIDDVKTNISNFINHQFNVLKIRK